MKNVRNAMTLDEFLKEQRRELAEFERYWLKNASSHTDEFPMKMLAGDWDEQLRFFVTLPKEER